MKKAYFCISLVFLYQTPGKYNGLMLCIIMMMLSYYFMLLFNRSYDLIYLFTFVVVVIIFVVGGTWYRVREAGGEVILFLQAHTYTPTPTHGCFSTVLHQTPAEMHKYFTISRSVLKEKW